MSKNTILRAESVSFAYGQSAQQVPVLEDLNLAVHAGERIAIMGSSGAGKSTLLNLLGGLDSPSSGKVWLGSACLSQLSADERAALRNVHLGFVYQFHHLLLEFSALENVAMPCLIAGMPRADAYAKAEALLRGVGLDHRLAHRPSALSGGERQRVAVARALVMQANCVLMDEPTGNLDASNAAQVMQLINELSKQFDTAVVIVTHDQSLANNMDRQLLLRDGRLEPQ